MNTEMAKVNALPALCSSGRLQSPALRYGDGSQSASGEELRELHKRSSKTPHEQAMVKREIEGTDRAIDWLVYELYGLTEEEVKIVEA